MQGASDSGQAARIMQIDFSAALDRVNHQGILYKLCPLGIRGSVSSVLTQFLSNRSQHVKVDGCLSKLVDFFQQSRREVFWARRCSSCNL